MTPDSEPSSSQGTRSAKRSLLAEPGIEAGAARRRAKFEKRKEEIETDYAERSPKLTESWKLAGEAPKP